MSQISLTAYCPAVSTKGGLGPEDIRDGAITAAKLDSALKSSAIANLDGGAQLSDVITKVNTILAALRKAGLVASS